MQDHYDDLEAKCKYAIGNFTERESEVGHFESIVVAMCGWDDVLSNEHHRWCNITLLSRTTLPA